MVTQPFFIWSKDYEIGHEYIDYQHRRLVEQINQLYKDKDSYPDSPLVLEVFLDQLVEYTEFHFSAEELYMKEIKYKDYDEHKSLHDALRRKV